MIQGLSAWSIVFALGAAQGLIIALALLSVRGGNRIALRTAAILALILAAILAEESIDSARMAMRWPWSVGATISFEFLVGPLVYLFVRANTRPRTQFVRRDLLHFLPFVVSIAMLLPFYATSGAERLALINGEMPLSLIFILALKPCHFIVYLAFTFPLLRPSAANESVTDAGRGQSIAWVRRGVYAMAGIMAVSVLLLALGAAGLDVMVGSDRFSGLALTAAGYSLTFAAFRKVGPRNALSSSPEAGKYSTSSLSVEEKKLYAERLVTYMESEAPYLDFDFRLKTLARGVNLPRHHVSQILNEELACSFREFVNQHRVHHAKLLIQNPKNRQKTLLAIAMESGFNSKASFNRAFNRHAGLTPSAYRDQAR